MDELCDLRWSPSNAKQVASLEVACAQADADWRIADAMANVMGDEAEQTPTLFNAQRFHHFHAKRMDERDRLDHLQRIREWAREVVRGEESDDLPTPMLAGVR
jgi:hypothetical protein